MLTLTVDHTFERCHCRSRQPSRRRLNDAHGSRSVDRSSMAPVGRLSNEALASLFGLSGVFFSRATARSPLRARALRGSRRGRVRSSVGAPRRDYRSFLTAIQGKPVPTPGQGRHRTALAPTAMHALHVCAHGGSNHIYSGGGNRFSCNPHIMFHLGKPFPRYQGARGGQT